MAVSSSIRDNRLVVSVDGQFNFDHHAAFNAATAAIGVDRSLSTLEINLFDVSYIDSSALGMLLVLKEAATKAGIRECILSGARDPVKQVLEIAHFEKFYSLQ